MSEAPLSIGRRRWLEAAAALAVSPSLPVVAADGPLPVFTELTAYLGGRTPRIERLVLDLPRVADNGNAVPLKLRMPGPFDADSYVRAIAVFAEKNPFPRVAEFAFVVPSPRVEIESRMRLAGSQRVVAIATLNDGVLYAAYADVAVTLSACLDGT